MGPGRIDHLIALSGIFLISFSAVFVRLAAVSPSTAAFFRVVYALPVLAVIWWVRRDRDTRTRKARWLAVLAGACLGVDLNVWHHSIEHIGAGLSTVLANTQVVFVAVLAWWLHRERPSRWALGLVPVVFMGVVLVSGLGRNDAYGKDPIVGVLFGIATGVSYTAFLMLLRASNRSLAPPVGPLFDATLGAVVAGALLGAFSGDLDLTPVWPAHGWLVVLALVSQVIGWLMITHALSRLAALETSILLVSQPMLTVLWGFLLFAERLSFVQWGGVGLVMLGIGLMSLLGSVERPEDVGKDVSG